MSSDPDMLQVDASGPGLLRSILRYKYAIAATALALALLAYVVSTFMTPVYEATATIVLSNASGLGDTAVDPERRTQQEANRLTSRPVFRTAGTKLGLDAALGDLERRVMVSADPAIGVIEVTAVSDTAQGAVLTANTVASTYETLRMRENAAQAEKATKVLRERGDRTATQIEQLRENGDGDSVITEQRIQSLETQLGALEGEISELQSDAALYGSGVEAIEEAILPSGPTSPQPLRNAVIAGVAGLGVASALAYWRAGVADAKKFDAGDALGAPLLAEIPLFGEADDDGVSPLFDVEAAEAYQFLASSLELVIERTKARSIVVTSASAGEGKSLTALHLARALASQGRDIVLIDSDVRAHGLTSMLRAEGMPGLSALAQGEALEKVTRRYRIAESAHLSLVPSGRPTGQFTGLFSTDPYREAMARAIDAHELAIIDVPPLLALADASAVAAHASGILMVIDARTERDELLRVQSRLRVIPTPVLGYVLNRVPDVRRAPYAEQRQTTIRFGGRRRGLSASRPAGLSSLPDTQFADEG